MTRDELRTILMGIELTDAQAKAILDANSADITKALNRQRAELDDAKSALKKANETIAALEKDKGDTEALQKQIDAYKAADQERTQAEKAAAARREVLERMDAVMDGRRFIHARMRDIVADEFGKAIADKANTGKADREIFDAVTKDQGYFASQNPPAGNMGGAGGITDEAAHMAAMRAAMGLPAEKK